LIYRFNLILVKIPVGLFAENEGQILNFKWKYKRLRGVKKKKKRTKLENFPILKLTKKR
jgi:hypothetical protein